MWYARAFSAACVGFAGLMYVWLAYSIPPDWGMAGSLMLLLPFWPAGFGVVFWIVCEVWNLIERAISGKEKS